MLACESKHVGLVALGLACVQKMAANGAVHRDKYLSILQTLQQVRVARSEPSWCRQVQVPGVNREPRRLDPAVRGRTRRTCPAKDPSDGPDAAPVTVVSEDEGATIKPLLD